MQTLTLAVAVTASLFLSIETLAQIPAADDTQQVNQLNANVSTGDIGSRRELFVDRYLIEKLTNARLQLHRPQPAGVAIEMNNPWEGPFSGYVTVIKDRDVYRMYYRGLARAGQDGTDNEVTCCAVSLDGIKWKKPDLGLYELNGSKDNNIVLMGQTPASHNFAPFLDANPNVPADRRYKALGGTQSSGLIAFVSADGIHWRRLQDNPVFRKGIFDSQNVSFWSAAEQKYICYFRTWTKGEYAGFRTISRTTSDDFINWTEPVPMAFGDTPNEHLYTNQTTPYFRAPHIYLGLAARFMPGRRVITAKEADEIGVVKKYSGDCSDSVLLSSRGGNKYDRTFMESFLRPGIGQQNWVSRSNYAARGIVPTGDSEISMYVSRNYGQSTSHLQRYTLRTDGFASVSAGYSGGELLTRSLKFPKATETEIELKREHWHRQIKNLIKMPIVISLTPEFGSQSLHIESPLTLELPNTKQLGSTFTLAALVRSVPSGQRRLFSAYNGASTKPNELVFDFNSGDNIGADGAIRFHWNDFRLHADIGAIGDWSSETGDDDPHHIALTWNEGLAKLYFDGKLLNEKQMSDPQPVELALGNLRFGEDYPPTSLANEPFIGSVDDIVVLKRALDDEMINKLAQDGMTSVIDKDKDKGIAISFEPAATLAHDDMSLEFKNLIGESVRYDSGYEFATRQLSVNLATSAAGSVFVELQDEQGNPIEGFALNDCDEIIGDKIEHFVTWNGKSDVAQLADKPIRLRFVLKDADLYSIQFK